MNDGLQYNGEKVEGFSAKCDKCESTRVSLGYEFNYYGGLTGWLAGINPCGWSALNASNARD